MKTATLVQIRAAEEITENGSISAALASVERVINSPEYPRAARVFLRRVRNELLNQGNRAFYAQNS